MDKAIMDKVVNIARKAGDAILAIYGRDNFGVEVKSDQSPVTLADLASHRAICPALEALLPGTPVLSEEAPVPAFSERRQWQRYWIIDPLDGTKEFISRNGEFTVNIALIDSHKPVLGVVHVPVSGLTYTGLKGYGAFRIDDDNRRRISVRSMDDRAQNCVPVTVVASRRHGSKEVEALMQRIGGELGPVVTRNMGSSLKFCLVAEGEADFYPRLAPTCEWDTAAAQAVVEQAGGVVLDLSLEKLRYNTKEVLLNPCFYVIGDPGFDWRRLLAS